MRAIVRAIVFVLSFLSAQSYPWEAPSNLNPVHGLYVKPSSDGTTGDLYVAATEDNGLSTQWIADQAINFLPVAAASQTHPKAVPLSYPPTYPQPHDDATNKKRAIISNPIPTPQMQYAYAMPAQPGASGEGAPYASYPYAFPFPSSLPESTPQCDATPGNVPHYPYHFPFNFFYPHMTSAYSNAMSILKDTGLSEDTASSVMAKTSPMWPQAPYAYPMMYVMMDPSAWIQSQTPTISSTPAATSSSTASNESS